jgi:hypothetical protein
MSLGVAFSLFSLSKTIVVLNLHTHRGRAMRASGALLPGAEEGGQHAEHGYTVSGL